MNATSSNIQKQNTNRVEPRKFTLWLLIIGMCMLFAAFTSAYIVRQAEGNWFEFKLPNVFLYSTIIVVLSSFSMFMAYNAAKKDELSQVKLGLILTVSLGILFCYLQYMGWQDIVQRNLYFSNADDGTKVSASFVYVISGLHLLHIIGGIIFLFAVIGKSFALQVHKKNLLLINMCNTYWHFVGILWVYLYLFLYLTRQF
jgi:cytochrome c oxidase subunit 3